MGFFNNFAKAMADDPELVGERYEVAGHPVTCSHCGGQRFFQGKAQLNTAAMTFFDLDFLNSTAEIYECTNCGHIEWFVRQ